MKKNRTDRTLRKRMPLGRSSTIGKLRNPVIPNDFTIRESGYLHFSSIASRMVSREQFDIHLLNVLAECLDSFSTLPDEKKILLAGLHSAQEELANELEANLWLLQLESSVGGSKHSELEKEKVWLSCTVLSDIVQRGRISYEKAMIIRRSVLAAQKQLDG